jgi:hypothetical protein
MHSRWIASVELGLAFGNCLDTCQTSCHPQEVLLLTPSLLPTPNTLITYNLMAFFSILSLRPTRYGTEDASAAVALNISIHCRTGA